MWFGLRLRLMERHADARRQRTLAACGHVYGANATAMAVSRIMSATEVELFKLVLLPHLIAARRSGGVGPQRLQAKGCVAPGPRRGCRIRVTAFVVLARPNHRILLPPV